MRATVGEVVEATKKVTRWTKIIKKAKEAKKVRLPAHAPVCTVAIPTHTCCSKRDWALQAYDLIKDVVEVGTTVYESVKAYQDAFSEEFKTQTSDEINAQVDARYGVGTAAALFIKKSCTPIASIRNRGPWHEDAFSAIEPVGPCPWSRRLRSLPVHMGHGSGDVGLQLFWLPPRGRHPAAGDGWRDGDLTSLQRTHSHSLVPLAVPSPSTAHPGTIPSSGLARCSLSARRRP